MRHSLLASYLLGLLLLSALIGAVVQMTEIERFIALARRFEPAWLAVCVTLQSATYLCESVAWNRILNRLGYAFDIRQLLPLSIGKFFSDQAMPSAGLMASVVMSVSPVPLGLGTFEAACVAMLHGAGTGLEAGLAATLMLRGFTTWLPMLPGIWLIRREMAYRSTSL